MCVDENSVLSYPYYTLVKVYIDLLVFMRIAGGRYWC